MRGRRVTKAQPWAGISERFQRWHVSHSAARYAKGFSSALGPYIDGMSVDEKKLRGLRCFSGVEELF